MMSDTFASRGLRAACAVGLAGMLSACAASAPPLPPQQQVYAPPAQPAPPAPQPVAPPAVQPPAAVQPYDKVQAPLRPRAEAQVAVGGTAFPVDGTEGRVPPGSRLVVRVYDAAGGDVNIRVAEAAFDVTDGIPARYEVPAPAQSVKGMGLPAVAARVEGPRGRVIYRNETAVLLKSGAAGDIPMTRQRLQAASTGTSQTWATPLAQ